MQNNGDFEVRTEDQRVVDGQVQAVQPYASSLPDTEHRMPALFSADNERKENAKIEANKDLRGFTRARDHGKGVSIDRKALVARAEQLADKDLENYRSRHGSITAAEYIRLFEVYKHTYMAEISEILNSDPEVIGWLENPRDVALRAQAIKDRDTVRSIGPDHRLSHHRRDLGVLRVMIMYNIDLDQALGDLEKLHDLIDRYEEYQRKSGNEVIWPAPATFQ
jgi:hypothetical protein